MPGIDRSITMTSISTWPISRLICSPLAISATTLRLGLLSSNSRNPVRTTSWSSTNATLSTCPPTLAPPRPGEFDMQQHTLALARLHLKSPLQQVDAILYAAQPHSLHY